MTHVPGHTGGDPFADEGTTTNAPSTVRFDANGQAFQWTGSDWVRVPIFDDPTKAGDAPRQPSVSVSLRDPNALALERAQLEEQIRQFDQEIQLAAQNQQFDQQFALMQERNRLVAQRQSIDAQFGQLEQQQRFSAEQAAIDRGLSASTTAADFALQNQVQGRATQGQEFEQTRASQLDALDAANQFARLISLVDPGALPAFLQAGGGVISNALARGADALSENALLPASRTLMAAERIPDRPAPFQFSPVDFDPFQFPASSFMPAGGGGAPAGGAAGGGGGAVQPQGVQLFPVTGDPTRAVDTSGIFAGQIAAGQMPTQEQIRSALLAGLGAQGTGSQPVNPESLVPGMPNITAAPVPAMAGGGADVLSPLVRVGEPVGGRPNPEVVLKRPGDPMMVVPERMLRRERRADGREVLMPGADDVIMPGERMPGAQTGGTFGSIATPQDEPFLQRVRDIRQGVQLPSLLGGGDPTFNTKFFSLAPSLISRFLAGRQTKFGAPVEDQLAEAQRFRLQGIGRGSPAFAR